MKMMVTNFNHFHSSQRIVVKCSFGEVDMRWGILWKLINFTMKYNMEIIDSCLRLHNLIIEYQIKKSPNDSISAEEDHYAFEKEVRIFKWQNPGENDGVGSRSGRGAVGHLSFYKVQSQEHWKELLIASYAVLQIDNYDILL